MTRTQARLRAAQSACQAVRAAPRRMCSRASSRRPGRAPRRRAHALAPAAGAAPRACSCSCGIALAANISVRYFADAGAKALPSPSAGTRDRGGASLADRPAGTRGHGDRLRLHRAAAGKRHRLHDPVRALRASARRSPSPASRCRRAASGPPGRSRRRRRLRPAVGPPARARHACAPRPPRAGGRRRRRRITFEDGTTDTAPMHGRWFAYAVAGERTRAGHRPAQLTVVHDGRSIRHRALAPASFNTLAAARALVPAGDGSRGQDAIRRYLLEGLDSRLTPTGARSPRNRSLRHAARSVAWRSLPGRRARSMRRRCGHMSDRAGVGSIILGLADGLRARSCRSAARVRAAGARRSGSPAGAMRGSAAPGGDLRRALRRRAAPRRARRGAHSDGRERARRSSPPAASGSGSGTNGPAQRPVPLVGRDAAGGHCRDPAAARPRRLSR